MRKKFFQFSFYGPTICIDYVSTYNLYIAPSDKRYGLKFKVDNEAIDMGNKPWSLESYLQDSYLLRKLFRVLVSDNFLELEKNEAEKYNEMFLTKIKNEEAQKLLTQRKQEAERLRLRRLEDADDTAFFDRLR